MGKRPCCDKANVKRGHWTPQEDLHLKAFIQRYGTHGDWMSLPQRAGLRRCGKSCRLRWLNYLRPGIKHGHFSQEEDNVICRLYSVFGSKWSVIASHLPGRTDNDIKNYWNTRLKFKWSELENNRVSATAEVMSAALNANDDGECSEVSVECGFHGSMADETGTIPSSDTCVEKQSPLAFGPDEDPFEIAALLRAICNTNMKTTGAAPQDHPEFSYSAVDMPVPVTSSGSCGFLSFDESYGPSLLDSQVSAAANSSDCESPVDISKPFPLFQEGGETKEYSRMNTVYSAAAHSADEELHDPTAENCPRFSILSFLA